MYFTAKTATAVIALTAPLLTNALVPRANTGSTTSTTSSSSSSSTASLSASTPTATASQSPTPSSISAAAASAVGTAAYNDTGDDAYYDDTYENLQPVYIPTTEPVDNVTVIPNDSPDKGDDGILDNGSGNLAFAGVADYTITDQLSAAYDKAFNDSLALLKTTASAYDAAQDAISELIKNATIQAQAAILRDPRLTAIQQGIDYFEENADPSDPNFNATSAQYETNVTTVQNFIDQQVQAVLTSGAVTPFMNLINSVDAAQQKSLANAVQTSNMTSTGNQTLDAVCGAGNSYCTSVVDSCANKKTLANATMAYGYTNGTAAPGTTKGSSCVCVSIPDLGSDPDGNAYVGQCQDLSLLEYTAACVCNSTYSSAACCGALADGIVHENPANNVANWPGLAKLNATAPLLRGSSGYIATDAFDDFNSTDMGNSTSTSANAPMNGTATGMSLISSGTVSTS